MIEKIDIHITEHCNLNCVSCTHFSPLAEEFYLDIDIFDRDLKRLSELTQGKVKQIFLLGGEPLLHKELVDFFPVARNLFKDSELIIITNGTLLSKQEDRFWKACRRYNIKIWVSRYGLNIDYTSIDKTAKDFGVFLGYTSMNFDKDKNKIWSKYPLDLDGSQYWLDSFYHCPLKNCATLKDGKLYTCCTIPHIDHFNKFFNKNLEVSPYDYIDIFKVKNGAELESALVKPIPFCRYCKTTQQQVCYWAPSKKNINEWL